MKALIAIASAMLLMTTVGEPAAGQSTNAPNGGANPAADAQASAATRRLRDFLERDWNYWVDQYPEAATVFGVPGKNDRWTDLSPAAIAKRNQHLEGELKELQSIPRAELPAGEQLNYDLYLDALKTAIGGLRFHHDAFPLASVVPTNLYMPINQLQGLPQDLPNTIEVMPAARAKDYEDIIARLIGVPALVDQDIALMKEGLAHGWTTPKITMRDVPQQIEKQIVSDPLTSPLLATFKKIPGTIPTTQQNELTSKAKAAYSGKVAPALRKLDDFLVHTYIPACRSTISVQDLPDGAEYYKYLVRWHTTTGLMPTQIHQTGLDQVKQIRAQMDEVIAASGFKGNFGDFVKFMNSDRRFTYASADELLIHFRDVAKRADPQLAHLFGTLPRLPYGIKAVPEAVAPSQTAAYYEQGAPPAGRPGYVYVNTYKLDSRPSWDAEDLLLHEGVPGHHLQISMAQELEGVPEFRKQIAYTAFVEGWALYSESLGTEMGFYSDPYSKFGYLSAQMWRAVRLVVDTGIHSMGWSRDQAIQYFKENAGQPDQNVVAEIDRYIVWPGQALGYKIGQLKIRELRQMAEKDLGERFDVRAFHDTVVDQGALPLDLLQERVTKWVTREKTKAAH